VKFLADMGLARSTVAFLRARGYDAIHLRDEGLQRLDDDEIVEKALREGRVILTHDLDFGRIVALRRGRLPSVIAFRLTDMRPAQVNHYLGEVLGRFAEQLESGTLVSGSVTCLGQTASDVTWPGLSHTPTYWALPPRIAIYGGLILATKWRLIILPAGHRKTPNNERWSSISPCSCPLHDTLTPVETTRGSSFHPWFASHPSTLVCTSKVAL